MWGSGYGVAVGYGAFALVQGNLFYANRHSIAAQGNPFDGYVAVDNFVLSATPIWAEGETHGVQSDFDMHESGIRVPGSSPTDEDDVRGHQGGRGGDYVEIASNTFLSTGGNNYFNRGLSCRYQNIHDNVAMRKRTTGYEFTLRDEKGGAYGSREGEGMFANLAYNAYSASDPTKATAMGDFDGDGTDDVFVGTGAGWYFSSGGRSEWRFLSRKSEATTALRFGDFDKDGRTDVVALRGAEVVVSWAGISDWQVINVTAGKLEDIAVGDFDGDGFSDLFYANGTDWYVAPKGRNWGYFATSVQRTPDLRFGDFNHDLRTDVFAHAAGGWSIVDHAGGQWTPIGPARSTNTSELFVADFDGDGIADVARLTGAGSSGGVYWVALQVSKGGTAAFVNQGLFPLVASSGMPAIGRFDGSPGADLLWWLGQRWSIATGGTGTFVDSSRQDMR